MEINSLIVLPVFGAILNFLMFQDSGTAPGPVKAFPSSSIFFIALGLALAVIIVVGLPFYMNYRRQVLPNEKQEQNNGKNANNS
jgi:hypothetical protein